MDDRSPISTHLSGALESLRLAQNAARGYDQVRSGIGGAIAGVMFALSALQRTTPRITARNLLVDRRTDLGRLGEHGVVGFDLVLYGMVIWLECAPGVLLHEAVAAVSAWYGFDLDRELEIRSEGRPLPLPVTTDVATLRPGERLEVVPGTGGGGR